MWPIRFKCNHELKGSHSENLSLPNAVQERWTSACMVATSRHGLSLIDGNHQRDSVSPDMTLLCLCAMFGNTFQTDFTLNTVSRSTRCWAVKFRWIWLQVLFHFGKLSQPYAYNNKTVSNMREATGVLCLCCSCLLLFCLYFIVVQSMSSRALSRW